MFNLFKKKREQMEVPQDNADDTKFIGKFAKDKDGKGKMLHIIGEKYPLRGQPTRNDLGVLGPVKSLIDKLLTSRLPDLIIHEIPYNDLSMPVRAFYDVLGELIEAEKLGEHKKRWTKFRKFLCYFLENDFPYRYRIQWLMERWAKRINEIKLSEGDKFHFRVKNFTVDLEEEYKEAIQKYPQLKDRMEEFKEFLSVGCWGSQSKEGDDTWRLGTISDLAQRFIDNQLTK